jgi:hypothetical protein
MVQMNHGLVETIVATFRHMQYGFEAVANWSLVRLSSVIMSFKGHR